jgi:putative membrane protein
MGPEFDSLAQGFPLLIFYLTTVAAIYVAGMFIYVKLTPHKEFALVADGNMAAAVHLSATVISLALPLAACLVNKIGLVDVLVWGTFSLFLQLFLFRLTDAIFRGMPALIEANVVAPTVVLAAFKLAGSIILAFAISG